MLDRFQRSKIEISLLKNESQIQEYATPILIIVRSVVTVE